MTNSNDYKGKMTNNNEMNYERTKIYKIESLLGDKIYIGSTILKYLSDRMTKHRADYKRWKQGIGGKVSSFELFEEYGVENCIIVLLESCSCKSKDEKNARESHYIRTMECVNKKIPDRKKEEYAKTDQFKQVKARLDKKHYDKNKEKLIAYQKDHREKNKEKFSAIIECQCGSKFQFENKYHHLKTKKHMLHLESIIPA
jgi:hypothetical protein